VDASIVIVSYNGRDLLRRCLASVHEHTRGLEYEVIVIDNASHDGTPEMVASEFPRATLIRRGTNDGFARGVNEGFAVAQGDALFVLNPDCELSSDVLAPMLAYLRSHPDIGILAPKLLDPDGTLQLSCRAFPGFSTALFNRYSLLTRLFRNNPASRRYLMTDFDHSAIADVDWISAACWLLPRSTYEAIGGLDEAYFWSIEDVDYCQRVHRAGQRVVYFPEVSLRHEIGGSSSSAPARAVIARHRGMWRYYSSYMRPKGPQRVVVDAFVWAGIQVRLGAQLLMGAARRLLRR
jgi:GT2 family glycosyltransferase